MLKILKYFNLKQVLFIIISLGFIVFQVFLDLRLPDYTKDIMVEVQTNASVGAVVEKGLYMLGCAIGSMITSVIVGYFAANVAAGLSKTLREKVFTHTLSFSMEEMNKFSPSSLITRCTNDITQIQMLIAIGLQAIIKAPILVVWAIIKIAGKNIQWTMATGVAVLVLLVMLSFILLIAVPKFRKIQGLTDNINKVTGENLSGIRVVRAYNAEGYEENKFKKANDEISGTYMSAGRVMAIMMPGMMLINSGLTLAVYWIGTYLIDEATMMDKIELFADMTVFLNYAMQIIMAFMLLVFIFILLPRAQVSANRIMEVLKTKTLIKDGSRVDSKDSEKGIVEFKNVSFKYPDAGDYVLKNISFKANKGETVAFIGSTGSGKSSLINLIPRFYDITDGEITVDGVDVRNYKLKDLRDKIGYVSQKTVMFMGDITSNVAFGKDGSFQDQKVIDAVDIAQGKEFVEQMEGQYSASISQGGTNVSGGQKQRLSIARAIYKDPEIFVFDDSFSALDYKTDRVLRSKLKEATSESTKLIVAQRIGTIKDADQIIVLEHGEIVGKGTHSELMKNCETYQEIAYSQLSKEELANE